MGLLSKNEIESNLQKLPGWESTGIELKKEFEFPTFTDAMIFINEVAQISESMQHFPEMKVIHNKVTLLVSTPSMAGITDNDIELAKRAQDAEKTVIGDAVV